MYISPFQNKKLIPYVTESLIYIYYTYTLHSLHTQSTYTIDIHSLHTQSTYTIYIHNRHTQSTYTIYIHNLHTQSTSNTHINEGHPVCSIILILVFVLQHLLLFILKHFMSKHLLHNY